MITAIISFAVSGIINGSTQKLKEEMIACKDKFLR
jgi:hypothetical protein